jgi:hypothetical protein
MSEAGITHKPEVERAITLFLDAIRKEYAID